MHNIFKIDCHMLCNFIEITLWHGCSPVNLLHIFRTIFSKNTSGWLLLGCNSCQTSNHILWCSKKNKKYARLAVNTYPLKNVALKFRALYRIMSNCQEICLSSKQYWNFGMAKTVILLIVTVFCEFKVFDSMLIDIP